jgi:hypothetical protein
MPAPSVKSVGGIAHGLPSTGRPWVATVATRRGSDFKAQKGLTLSLPARFRWLRSTSRASAADDPTAGEASDHATDHESADDTAAVDEPAADSAAGAVATDTREKRPAAGRVRAALSWLTTILAVALVMFALLTPNNLARITPGAFVSIPVEGLVFVALVLLLPAKAHRVVVLVFGVALGLLTIVKALDMGFIAVLARPFHTVLDWILLESAFDFLAKSFGLAIGIGAAIAAVLLATAILVFMTLAVRRLARILARQDTAPATRVVAVMGIIWVSVALFGVQIVPGVPLAGNDASVFTYRQAMLVSEGLKDREAFAAEAAVDAFRNTPGDQLLTALRGKDVILAFVESYGRDAIEDPLFAPQVGAVLDAGQQRLNAAGYASKSAFLTSSTAGGGSWLAHATFLSGLWIDNQQRYRTLVSSDRLTLNGAFRRAGWRTVAVMPGTTRAWPEGDFFGYDRIYAAADMGYRGPGFNWDTMPDQYALSFFERTERGNRDHAPLMAQIVLVSSHAPWAPTPQKIAWDSVGDGSAFTLQAGAGDPPEAILLRDPAQVRAEYRRSIEYSLDTFISYVETYGDDDLVVIFLGDHEPTPLVTGAEAGRDAPISIVTRDKAVLDKIAGWGWQDGIKPAPQAPVWRMNTFRDQFLTAFGPTSQPSPTPK